MTARKFPTRDPFDFPDWIAGWVHPFESKISLYQKYSWINDASSYEYSRLINSLREPNPSVYRSSGSVEDERDNLHKRLYGSLPIEHQPPTIWLWDTCGFPHAVCPQCLDAGYWSEWPQLLGCDSCPLHDVRLRRRCSRCLEPLRFGQPIFGEAGAFICQSCGEPMIESPGNAWLQWHRSPSPALIGRFMNVDNVTQQLRSDCSGKWAFPSPHDRIDHRIVMNSISGNRLQHEWNAAPSLVGDQMFERVETATFCIPCDKRVLTRELRDARLALMADFKHRCRNRGIQKVGAKNRAIKIERGGEVSYYAGGSLVDDVESILLQLDTYADPRNSEKFEILTSFQDYSSVGRGNPSSDQLTKIVIALAVWQVARIVFMIAKLSDELLMGLDGKQDIDDETDGIIYQEKYAQLRLLRARTGERAFRYILRPSAWIPPYRVQLTPRKFEVTVFQIVPTELT